MMLVQILSARLMASLYIIGHIQERNTTNVILVATLSLILQHMRMHTREKCCKCEIVQILVYTCEGSYRREIL